MNSIIKNKLEPFIIKTEKAEYVFLPHLGILVNSELKHNFANSLKVEVDEEKLIENLRKVPSDEDIESHLGSIRSITINISNYCSFRCKYCIYSGSYELVRKHNNKVMNFEIAKKIIDHFIIWIKSKNRKFKAKPVNFGFYGGEPITEWQLIMDIIAYTKKRFLETGASKIFEPGFRLNTNGYNLNGGIVDLLVTNDIKIDVSLDGPQEEHDKFRITRNGKSTWDVIWSNLKELKSRYPDYYAKKVNFLVTLHPLHDHNKIDRFFIDNPDYFDLENVNAYFLNTRLLREDFKRKWFKDQISQVSQLVLMKSSKRLDNKLMLTGINSSTQFTAMCFPVEAKLFAATDGTIHICEKIKPDLPIGDADNGINYDAVRRIQRLWNEEIIRNRCWECPAWSFCSVCLAQSEDKNGVRVNCTYKDQAYKILKGYIEHKEEEDRKESINFNMKTVNVMEYIRQL